MPPPLLRTGRRHRDSLLVLFGSAEAPTEVVLTEEDGLAHICAANFDNLQSVPKTRIGNRIAQLSRRRMKEMAAAVSFALALDED